MLGCYVLVVGAALLVQIVVALYVIVQYGHIREARAVSAAGDFSATISAMEGDVLDVARARPADWIETQDYFQCCGWDLATNVDPQIANGDACVAHGAPTGAGAKAAAADEAARADVLQRR